MKNRSFKLGFYAFATICWFGAAIVQYMNGDLKLAISNLILGALTLGLTLFWMKSKQK